MYQDNLYTAESVTLGQPDKMCDVIVDAALDAVLAKDRFARVELEAMATRGLCLLSGTVTTKSWVDLTKVVRNTIREIGYDDPELGFESDNIAVLTHLEEQPDSLALAVDLHGAGNQGVFVGYATDESAGLSFDTNYMPVPIYLAHQLARSIYDLCQSEDGSGLYPDGQSQITVHYVDGIPAHIHNVVVAGQHHPDMPLNRVREYLTEKVLRQVLEPTGLFNDRTRMMVNPAGIFNVGGPLSDVGVSGRRQIVDHYGTMCRHGGAALSGKDPTKTDRSGSYMARYLAKNIVAAGLAHKCEVRLIYVLGIEQPLTVQISLYESGEASAERIAQAIQERFDLSTAAIIEHLNLRRPIYKATACYGHFGRQNKDFTWEVLDCADDLKELVS